MRNKRILNCSIRIPHYELIESGIPKEFHHFLKYQRVTREEAYELVGYKLSGWVVLFCDPKGNPYLHKGNLFYLIIKILLNQKGKYRYLYLNKKIIGKMAKQLILLTRPIFKRFSINSYI